MTDHPMDMDAHDRRAHNVALVTMGCRYAFGVVLVLVLAMSWSCRDGASLTASQERAARAAGFSDGVASECRRWTP